MSSGDGGSMSDFIEAHSCSAMPCPMRTLSPTVRGVFEEDIPTFKVLCKRRVLEYDILHRVTSARGITILLLILTR